MEENPHPNLQKNDLDNILANVIRMKQKNIIASDGSKLRKVLGWAWIIADTSCNEILLGLNSDFENIA